MGNSERCTGQATNMRVCLFFVCCTILGSHAMGYYGKGGYRGMTLDVQDGDGKTLTFKTSSSSSEENTRNSREAGNQTLQESGEGHWCPPHCHWNGHRCVCHHDDKEEPTKPTETSQEGGEGHGCPWPCRWEHHHCWCPHEDSEKPTKPTEPDEGSDEGNMCEYCIHAHCFPAVCKHNHCCFHHQEAEPSNKTSTSQESGEGHPCPPHCHHQGHRCVCHHKDSEELTIPPYKQHTIPNEEKSSVQKLVSAGLDLLKAGKKLKFNVDVKTPEALLGAKKTSQEGGEGLGCHLPCHWKHHHCWCPHKDSEEPTKPTETSQESGEGHWCPHHCHWNGHRCVCHHKDSEEPPISPPIPSEEKSSVQKLVSAGLDLLKAGKKLKFNVDVKNPEALLGANQPSQESAETGHHICPPRCHWNGHRCVCH